MNKIRSHKFYLTIYIAATSFLTYALMYAFRKPYAAATYLDMPSVLGIPFKDAGVLLQLMGYSVSKLLGIKRIAELNPAGRGRYLFFLVFVSWAALFLFAIIPPPWNVVCLFFNGLPLGLIWGIVFSFVEGRTTSDFIGSALAVSFIFSSGIVKSIGRYIMADWHVTDVWMPFVTGGLAILPLCAMVYLLVRTPSPTLQDHICREKRVSMYRQERRRFIKKFLTGILLLVIIYTFLTLFRDIRDNFMADMWKEINHGSTFRPEIFADIETPVSLILLIMMSAMVWVKNNRTAFQISGFMVLTGFLITAVASWMFMQQMLSPFNWMLFTGIGLYMGYIPFNCILYDRLIAYLRTPANVGFLMYVSDASGYFASLLVIMLKSVAAAHVKWTIVYSHGVWWFSLAGIVLTGLAWIYFLGSGRQTNYQYASS
ncbi:MAG: hypothetical protein IRZ01_07865 [Thermoflavifilum aggregans]|nr:hypothetical protein [Thermoflavifilum aggregans]